MSSSVVMLLGIEARQRGDVVRVRQFMYHFDHFKSSSLLFVQLLFLALLHTTILSDLTFLDHDLAHVAFLQDSS
jgi:hypothetical protein